MDPSFPNNVGSGLFQNNTWGENNPPHSLPANSPEQYHLCIPSQDISDIGSSNTQTHATPFSVSGSTLIGTPISPLGTITLFPDGYPRTQEMAATTHWRSSGAAQYSGVDFGGFSPAPKFDASNMILRMNGGIGNKRPTSPSQVAKVDDYSDLASVGTWTHKLESFGGGALGNSRLSRWKRLLIEPHSRTRGWHCPICHHRFKRRDYIRPHVKRKHIEWYHGLYCTLSSSPERSVAAPADQHAACGDLLASGLLEGEQAQPPMAVRAPPVSLQTTSSLQSNNVFLGSSMTPQRRSFDLVSSDGGNFPGGLEHESPSCLKTSYDNSTRSLACPFYKHEPLQHRKCSTHLLRRPKDVKQHIYRSHTQPEFYCARCYYIFQTATERDAHWRQQLCNGLDGSILLEFQGITEDQKRVLNEKSPRDLSVEAQWYQIYNIIFPDSKFPKSPYVGNWLEEIVPLLREKWDAQAYKITAQAVGDSGRQQLSFAMDLFFRSLESEACGNGGDSFSIHAASS